MKSAGKDPLKPLENRANAALEALEYREELSKVCREQFGKDCAPGRDFGKVDETGKNYCADVYETKPGNGVEANIINLNKPLGKVCVPAKQKDGFPDTVRNSIFAPAPSWATKPALDTENLDRAETQVAGDFAELEAETATPNTTQTQVDALQKQLGAETVKNLEEKVQKISAQFPQFPLLEVRLKVYQGYLKAHPQK